jgi:hypothetical protein
MVHNNGDCSAFPGFRGAAPDDNVILCAGLVWQVKFFFPPIHEDKMFTGMISARSELIRQASMPAVIWHDEGAPKLFAKRAILLGDNIKLLAQDEFLEMSIAWGIFNMELKARLISLIESERWDEVRALSNPIFTLDQGT